MSFSDPMFAGLRTQTIPIGDATIEHPDTEDVGTRIVLIAIVSIAFLILISHIGILNLSTLSGN